MNPDQQVPIKEGLPHDIVGLTPYTDWSEIAMWCAVGALALALIWYLVRKYMKRPKAKKHETPGVVVDPLKIIRGKISTLDVAEPFDQKAQEDFFFSLSFFFREFLEQRFGFSATDQTYKELKAPIAKFVTLPADESQKLLGFFERADLIKFAEKPASVTEAKEWKNTIVGWLDKFKPIEKASQDTLAKRYDGRSKH